MSEYGFFLNRIFPYKDRIFDSVLTRESEVKEDAYSGIFYAVFLKHQMENPILYFPYFSAKCHLS